MPRDDPYGTKLTNIDRNGLGFHKPGMWDKVVDINKCHLQAKPSNEIRNAIRSYALEKKLAFFAYGFNSFCIAFS